MITTVIYQNGDCGLVSTDHLDELIATSTIKQFLRADGWAIIGRDPIRATKRESPDQGRRKRPLLLLDYFLDAGR